VNVRRGQVVPRLSPARSPSHFDRNSGFGWIDRIVEQTSVSSVEPAETEIAEEVGMQFGKGWLRIASLVKVDFLTQNGFVLRGPQQRICEKT
jgi:hypothetical protein